MTRKALAVMTAVVLAVAGCSSAGGSSATSSLTPSSLTQSTLTASSQAPSSQASSSQPSVVSDDAAVTTGSAIHATFRVDPPTTLTDQPVAITLSGLPAGQLVTVTAQAQDFDGTVWKSSAQFTASAAGNVSLAQASIGGSYRGSNPMALFEVMVPPSSSQSQFFQAPGVDTFPVTFQAVVAGATVAQVSVYRNTYLSKGVTTTGYLPAGSGIYGTYFAAPGTTGSRPAVLLFGGSEGGNAEMNEGKTLAADGIPTLTLAYFGEPGLPSALRNIPLEYFYKALQVLAAQPGIDRKKIFVFGISRGSEAALLLGVRYPDLVHGVVAGVPSALVVGDYPSTGQPAWTYRGAPVPFVPGSDFGTTNVSKYPDAVIPVEKIKGPILTDCGGADTVWPSCAYASAITRRLVTAHSPYHDVSLSYPDAGHYVGVMAGYDSVTTNGGDGGTVIANAAALADSHSQLLAFLLRN